MFSVFKDFLFGQPVVHLKVVSPTSLGSWNRSAKDIKVGAHCEAESEEGSGKIHPNEQRLDRKLKCVSKIAKRIKVHNYPEHT